MVTCSCVIIHHESSLRAFTAYYHIQSFLLFCGMFWRGSGPTLDVAVCGRSICLPLGTSAPPLDVCQQALVNQAFLVTLKTHPKWLPPQACAAEARVRCPGGDTMRRASQSSDIESTMSGNNSEEDSDVFTCRVCFEDAKPSELISPCNCSGTQKHVHLACLQHWQASVLRYLMLACIMPVALLIWFLVIYGLACDCSWLRGTPICPSLTMYPPPS